MSPGQVKNQFAIQKCDGRQRELADIAGFMFHIHLQIIRAENGSGQVQDFRKFSGRKAVVKVIGEPRLQAAMRIAAQSTAAIDEPFVDAGDLGDVRMGGNGFAVRQDKTEVCGRLFAQFIFEIKEFHKHQGFVVLIGQQPGSRKAQQAGTASRAPRHGASR